MKIEEYFLLFEWVGDKEPPAQLKVQPENKWASFSPCLIHHPNDFFRFFFHVAKISKKLGLVDVLVLLLRSGSDRTETSVDCRQSRFVCV